MEKDVVSTKAADCSRTHEGAIFRTMYSSQVRRSPRSGKPEIVSQEVMDARKKRAKELNLGWYL